MVAVEEVVLVLRGVVVVMIVAVVVKAVVLVELVEVVLGEGGWYGCDIAGWVARGF